jgi:hypothetical protein
MTSQRVSRLHRGLVAALVTIYVAAAIIGIFADEFGNKELWVVLLLGSAALIVAGTVLKKAPAWISVGLVGIGATVGGILLLWTVLVPIAAALLVGLTYSLSRREQAA